MDRLRGRWLGVGVVAVVVTSIAQGLSAHISRDTFSSDAWLVVALFVIAIPALLQARERASVRAGLAAGILLAFVETLVGVPISTVVGGVPLFDTDVSGDLPIVIVLVLIGTLIAGTMLGAVAGILGRLASPRRTTGGTAAISP